MKPKTVVLIGAIIAVLAVFVFGKEAISYLAGAREYTKVAFKDRIPTELEISRLKAMLGSLQCHREAPRGIGGHAAPG